MVDDTVYRESLPRRDRTDYIPECTDDYVVCSTCKWWVPFEKINQDNSKGECRRYPPCNDDVGCFPVTRIIDWCGEYKSLADDD